VDSQDYSTPLVVSRATFDEILTAMRAQGRLVPENALLHGVLDMRGVLLVKDGSPAARTR